jgi:hypothetical protein
MDELTSKEILDRFPIIKQFFKSLGYSEPTFIDRGLDSYWGFMNYPLEIEYGGEIRTCIQIKYKLIGGIIFVFSGKIGNLPFEDVHTDYDFNIKWQQKYQLLQSEFRDFKVKKLINN